MARIDWQSQHVETPIEKIVERIQENPEPRVPVILLLDVSGSMGGEPIAQLNRGIRDFSTTLKSDPLAAQQVELALMLFGPIRQHNFVPMKDFSPPTLEASGDTPTAKAILKAGELLRTRCELYKQARVDHFKPFVFLITDGRPNDGEPIEEAARMVREFETDPNRLARAAWFMAGVKNANMDVLTKLSCRHPIPVEACDFAAMLRWASISVHAISRSQIGDDVPLSNPFDNLRMGE